MPIFQEDLDHLQRPSPSPPHPQNPLPSRIPIDPTPLGPRRFSEESLPVELCEGPIPDSPEKHPKTPENQNEGLVLDRSILIQRLKRGESPSWIPNRHVRTQGGLIPG